MLYINTTPVLAILNVLVYYRFLKTWGFTLLCIASVCIGN